MCKLCVSRNHTYEYYVGTYEKFQLSNVCFLGNEAFTRTLCQIPRIKTQERKKSHQKSFKPFWLLCNTFLKNFQNIKREKWMKVGKKRIEIYWQIYYYEEKPHLTFEQLCSTSKVFFRRLMLISSSLCWCKWNALSYSDSLYPLGTYSPRQIYITARGFSTFTFSPDLAGSLAMNLLHMPYNTPNIQLWPFHPCFRIETCWKHFWFLPKHLSTSWWPSKITMSRTTRFTTARMRLMWLSPPMSFSTLLLSR